MAVLVIDVGSSSVRALLFDDQARPIPGALVSRAYTFTTNPPGAATIDAAELQSAVESCVDEILAHPAATNVVAVGLDSLVGNMLGVNDRGEPLTPIFTYADTRSAEDVAVLRDQVDVEAAHQRTGCIHHTAYQPGRIHWLRRTESELFGKVAMWTDFAAFLYRRWFGDAQCSYSVASWSGMLDRTALKWDEEWLDILGMDEAAFPPLADIQAVKVGLRPDYARRWPALRDVPFCLAVGDGAAANVGSGCVDSSHIALTVGTTGAIRMISSDDLPRVPDGLWNYRLDAEHHLTGGATSEGGNIFAWASKTLALENVESLETQLAGRPADGHGLTFLPLLAGERSPGWSANATGAIIGLRLSTTPLDILQAALEGVALRLALIAGQLGDLSGAAVIASGGALVSSLAWTQIIANALNCPLHLTADSEITARGTAILALRALGKGGLNDFPPEITAVVSPQPDGVAAMRAASARQVEIYQKFVREMSASL
jgi:gluconokinase